jgi:hypothetical protein
MYLHIYRYWHDMFFSFLCKCRYFYRTSPCVKCRQARDMCASLQQPEPIVNNIPVGETRRTLGDTNFAAEISMGCFGPDGEDIDGAVEDEVTYNYCIPIHVYMLVCMVRPKAISHPWLLISILDMIASKPHDTHTNISGLNVQLAECASLPSYQLQSMCQVQHMTLMEYTAHHIMFYIQWGLESTTWF